MEEKAKRLNRRELIKLALTGSAAMVAWQLRPNLKRADEGHDGIHKWVMLIDTDACIGCNYCTLSCKAHNDTAPDIRWNRLLETKAADGETRYLAVPCQHCEHAACVHACLVRATYQRPDGIVMMDYDRCIGCRYCEAACPYGARSFNWKAFEGENPLVPQWGTPEVPRRPRGVVEKCSFCYHRIDRGLAQGLTPGVDPDATPACVAACPVNARIFGDLNDPDSLVNQKLREKHADRLRADMGTEPRIYYLTEHPEVTG